MEGLGIFIGFVLVVSFNSFLEGVHSTLIGLFYSLLLFGLFRIQGFLKIGRLEKLRELQSSILKKVLSELSVSIGCLTLVLLIKLIIHLQNKEI